MGIGTLRRHYEAPEGDSPSNQASVETPAVTKPESEGKTKSKKKEKRSPDQAAAIGEGLVKGTLPEAERRAGEPPLVIEGDSPSNQAPEGGEGPEAP